MKMTASIKNFNNRAPLRSFLLIPFVLGCFTLATQTQATCQQGCLTNGNTVLGDDALLNNSGANNTAVGFQALFNNTTGSANTANGFQALFSNTTGYFNTANGFLALYSNTTGYANTANGLFALYSNTTGSDNAATGFQALLSSTTGANNTANGYNALLNNRAGNGNTASGVSALSANINGDKNTAVGIDALLSNTTGSFNIALGAEAGGNLTTASNNVDIANRGVPGESNTIRIGARQNQTNTYIAGISGATVAGGVGVIIDAQGHLGTVVSSARFKEEVKPIDKASEAILALKPVTFRYKKELDPEGVTQFGLVAEDVEKVNPALVARDTEGRVVTVRYEAVNAMLLNEFLKEHRKVESLEQAIVEQQKQIKVLTASLQRVSDQIELSKPVRTVMVSDPGKN